MTRGCPSIERFEDLMALDPSDPRRAHLDTCPRCRSRMIAFGAFMEVHPLPDGIRLDDARKQLSKVIREETSGAIERRRWRGLRLLASGFASPYRRVAIGAASLALAVAVFLQVTGERQKRPPFSLRGPEPTGELVVSPPTHSVLAGGALDLRWRAMETADGYRLLFSRPDLTEILRVEAGADTHLVLPAERVGELGSPGSVVFWRVVALHDGDTIAQSPPATIILP